MFIPKTVPKLWDPEGFWTRTATLLGSSDDIRVWVQVWGFGSAKRIFVQGVRRNLFFSVPLFAIYNISVLSVSLDRRAEQYSTAYMPLSGMGKAQF
jgi:hypothetical protein